MKVKVGLHGMNGHQIHDLLVDNERACCVAISGMTEEQIPKAYKNDPDVVIYDTFEEMLKDENVQVVSLCSAVRKDQEQEAMKALNAGKHVYSEKPAALSEEVLDEIIETAQKNNCLFHEMAGTAFEEPFLSMRDVVESGVLGEIVQVFGQKSYPYHDRRPQDDVTDGGLIRWVGVHATRFIEHTTGLKIDKIYATETTHGNPVKGGDMCTASSVMMTLDNGAVGSMVINYLHHRSFGTWGNEHLRIWGTEGFVEAVDGLTRTRLVLKDKDQGPIELKHENRDYFEYILDEIIDQKTMPISLEDELHPLRAVIRAKNNVVERVE